MDYADSGWLPSLVAWLVLVLAPGATSAADTQGVTAVREYVASQQQRRVDQLRVEHGRLKELPPGFELQALLALSHFPELKNVHIRFIVDDVDIPLSSRPHWPSMLQRPDKRTYLVVIDSEREGNSARDALLLKNQPFNAQVGILGHELAHTVYYLDRSFFGIAGDAVCQFSKCREEFERNTDKLLVARGLGWQRYDHAQFLRQAFAGEGTDLSATDEGGGAYMSPEELRQEMQRYSFYSD